jgi:hypothetical protein
MENMPLRLSADRHQGNLAKTSVRSHASVCYEVTHTAFVARFTSLACMLCHGRHRRNAADGLLSSF